MNKVMVSFFSPVQPIPTRLLNISPTKFVLQHSLAGGILHVPPSRKSSFNLLHAPKRDANLLFPLWQLVLVHFDRPRMPLSKHFFVCPNSTTRIIKEQRYDRPM